MKKLTFIGLTLVTIALILVTISIYRESPLDQTTDRSEAPVFSNEMGLEPTKTLSDYPNSKNRFDRDTLTIGDSVAGLTVINLNPLTFKGEITVSGTFDDFFGEPSFEPDAQFEELFPRAINDSRRIWFCVNGENVIQVYEKYKNSENVTITVDNYEITFRETMTCNQATLIKVVE